MGPLAAVEFVGQFSYFSFRAGLAALLSPLTRPGESLRMVYVVLMGALPLAVAAGLATGVVTWMHTHDILLRTGGPDAGQLLPTMLAVAVVMELAPMSAGLIVAARVGASLGAELGAMRLTEQIDALEVIGQSPMRELIGPRVLACMLCLPVLDVFIAYLAVLGGYAAEAMAGGMSVLQYATASLTELRLSDALPAVAKTVVFGFLIGVAGCFAGMGATGGTEGVGRAATRGVVLAVMLVLVSNVVLVKLIKLSF